MRATRRSAEEAMHGSCTRAGYWSHQTPSALTSSRTHLGNCEDTLPLPGVWRICHLADRMQCVWRAEMVVCNDKLCPLLCSIPLTIRAISTVAIDLFHQCVVS